MAKALVGLVLAVSALVAAPTRSEAAPISSVVLVGAPGEDVGAVANAGAVHLLPQPDPERPIIPTANRTITRATLGGTPAAGDAFGAAVLFADVTGDQLGDIVIGAPGADDGAGRVYVIPQHDGGFTFDDPIVLQQGRAGVKGITEPGDRFGASLASGWYFFRPVTARFLAIGAPGEDVGAARDAGAVTTMAVGFAPPAHGRSRVWYQGAEVAGTVVPGAAETGDRFGSALSAYGLGVAVGVPHEDLGAKADTGTVTVVQPYGPHQGAGEWREGREPVGGAAEPGDRFGAALGTVAGFTLLVGVPGQDVEGAGDAGMVVEIRDREPASAWAQGVTALTGTPEPGDHLGAAIGVSGGLVSIGVPGEDVGDVVDAGLIHTLSIGDPGEPLTAGDTRTLHQGSAGVPGTNEAGDGFGASIAAAGAALVVGVPGEDVHDVEDAGAIISIAFWDGGGVRASRSRQVTQDDLPPSKAEAGDRFGASLG